MQARALGFDTVGMTRAEQNPQATAWFEQFIADGAHGDMEWLAGTAARRTDPHVFWPRRALSDHARAELRAGQRSAVDPERSATAARSRSMRRATTITS